MLIYLKNNEREVALINIFVEIYRLGYYKLAGVFIFITLVYSIVNRILKKYGWYKFFCGLLCIVYIFVILFATILNRDGYPKTRELSLIPFASYKIAFNGNEEGFRTCFMNVLLFFPLGCIFYGINSKTKCKLWYFTLFSFCLSLIIEILQYVFYLGVAEVDDLIHNTLGAVLAYVLCYFFTKMIDLVIKQYKGMDN